MLCLACLRGGLILCLGTCSTDLVLRFFEGGLKILLRHLHFLLKEIQLRLDGLPEIFRCILQSLDSLSDLTPDLGQLFGAEQEKGNDQNDENLAGS